MRFTFLMSSAVVLAFSSRARSSGETAAEKDNMTKLQLFHDASSPAKSGAHACRPSRQMSSQLVLSQLPLTPESQSCSSLLAVHSQPATLTVPTAPIDYQTSSDFPSHRHHSHDLSQLLYIKIAFSQTLLEYCSKLF